MREIMICLLTWCNWSICN